MNDLEGGSYLDELGLELDVARHDSGGEGEGFGDQRELGGLCLGDVSLLLLDEGGLKRGAGPMSLLRMINFFPWTACVGG